MSNLPNYGDPGWGTTLNSFLGVSLNSDGTLKTSYVPVTGGVIGGNQIVISTTALGCTNTTGDGALIQAAINAVSLSTGIVLYIDCPVMLNESTGAYGIFWCVGWSRSNVSVVWGPSGVVNRTTTTGCPFFVFGGGNVAGMTQWGYNKFTDQPKTTFTGDGTILLTTAAFSSAGANFLSTDVGNYITINPAGSQVIHARISSYTDSSHVTINTTNTTGSDITNATWYIVRLLATNGVQTKGQNFITMNSSGLASNFVSGDYIYIATGELDSNLTPWPNPDAEFFRVSSVSGAIVYIEGALGKTYGQEYFTTSACVGITQVTSTAFPAPFGCSKVTGLITFNTKFINPKFNTAQTDRNQITWAQAIDCLIENTTMPDGAQCQSGLDTGRDRINYTARRNRFTTYGAGMGYWSQLSSSGDRDNLSQDNVYTAVGFSQQIALHEGGVRSVSRNDRCVGGLTSAGAGFGLWDIRSRCYDFLVDNPSGGGGFDYGILIDSTSFDPHQSPSGGTGGQIRMRSGAFTVAYARPLLIQSPGVEVSYTDTLTGLNGANPGSGAGISPVSPVLNQYENLTFSTVTHTFNYVPENATILRVTLITTTGFSGGSSPSIEVGISGTPARYVSLTALPSSAGVTNLTMNVGTGTPTLVSRQAPTVTITGSPTAGACLIFLEYTIMGGSS